MAAKPSQQTPTPQHPSDVHQDHVTADIPPTELTAEQMRELVMLNHEFAERLRHASRTYLDQAQDLQSALLELTREKYFIQLETGRSLMQASDIEGISRIQQAWIKRVSDQYAAEAARILQVVSDTTALPWSPLMSDDNDDTSRAA